MVRSVNLNNPGKTKHVLTGLQKRGEKGFFSNSMMFNSRKQSGKIILKKRESKIFEFKEQKSYKVHEEVSQKTCSQ